MTPLLEAPQNCVSVCVRVPLAVMCVKSPLYVLYFFFSFDLELLYLTLSVYFYEQNLGNIYDANVYKLSKIII